MLVFAGIFAAVAGEVRFDPPDGDAYDPVWSPDGRDLVFEVHWDDFVAVYLARPAEADVDAAPTSLPWEHWSLPVRHDKLRAFVSTTAENAELWVSARDEGEQRLSWTLADESYPAFAPDDERIAFQRTWEGRHGIVVQDLDNTRGVEVAEGERPVWAWDEIVFFRGDSIAVVRPGQAPRVLATGVRRPSYGRPAVTADGAWVLWTDGSRIAATSLDGALTIDIPAEHEHLDDLAVADHDGALVLAYTWSASDGAFRQLYTKSLAEDLPLAVPAAAASPKRWAWAAALAFLVAAAALMASRIARRRRA